MNIIVKRNYHEIPKSEREYGCECKNCGTVFIFNESEKVYRGAFMAQCPNCNETISLKDCTWLRNQKEIDQFIDCAYNSK